MDITIEKYLNVRPETAGMKAGAGVIITGSSWGEIVGAFRLYN